MIEIVPLSEEIDRALEFVRAGLAAIDVPGEDPRARWPGIEQSVRGGHATGGLFRRAGRTVGVALWDATSAMGVAVEMMHLDAGANDGRSYADAFDAVRRTAGPVAFAPGSYSGLDSAETDRTMRGLGFAPFARAEMRLPVDAPVPTERGLEGIHLRTPTAEDADRLGPLHAAAYAGTLDRYLFFIDTDAERDGERHVADMFGGRWGEFLDWASCVAEREDGGLVGGCLVVRAAFGPLIADVMSHPSVRGHGVGRAVLVRSVGALRARGETVIVLNVTEGNTPAISLYRHVGFVRTIGPGAGWYSLERVPVGPYGGYSAAAAGGTSRPEAR